MKCDSFHNCILSASEIIKAFTLYKEQVLGWVHSHLVEHQEAEKDLSRRQCDRWLVSRDAFSSQKAIKIYSIIYWKPLCFQNYLPAT